MALSGTEIGIVLRAVDRAPSVHNTQPWAVRPIADAVELYERPEIRLPHHDPDGRDRLVSCGAALTNIGLALRALGRAVTVSVCPDGARPDLVGTVAVDGYADASAREVDLYSAIFHRHSYRAPFSYRRPDYLTSRELVKLVERHGTRAHLVRRGDDTRAVADLLGYAASVLHADRAYQRELAAWSPQFPRPLTAGATLPWAGLVRADTRLPDRVTLYNRIADEAMLVLHCAADTARDHIVAGVSLQQSWLALIIHRMVASVLTQPLRLPEVRTGFAERLNLDGHPVALLRFGYPFTALPTDFEGTITYEDLSAPG